VISNITIAGNGSSSATGIVLNHINLNGNTTIAARITGTQTSIQSVGVGILVKNSSYVVLDGGGANGSGAGVGNVAGTINKNTVGAIDVENSSHIVVTGWQLSANGQDGNPDWVAFDPSLSNWGVGGVRFFATTSSTIDHNAANNCTSVSFSLFSSSGNAVTNNTADYPFTANFLVADG
jgi:parallel beta-helix repeat protein